MIEIFKFKGPIFKAIILLVLLTLAVGSVLILKDATPQKLILFLRDKTVEIEDSVDLANIMKIISTMEKKPSAEFHEYADKGIFIYNKIKKQRFMLEDGFVHLGGETYYGIYEASCIRDILNKYIYDKKFVVEKIQNSSRILLKAEDLKQYVELSDSQRSELVKCLESAFIEYEEIVGPKWGDYPDYVIEAYTQNPDNKKIVLCILNPEMMLETNGGFNVYVTDSHIWDFVSSIIPATESEENDVRYLFKADKVFVIESEKYTKDYSYAKTIFIRSLYDAEPSKKEEIINNNENEKLILKFTINGDSKIVEVYENGYIYNGICYKKTGILEQMKRIMSVP
ncbi:hypothetical protein [Thermosediminibacter litoriperuensis]|uniref:hypothetical protein n=1 Tax=Thermosediminibacter litoriperuensis TaxID=291989 RepID=UPI0011E800B9|nr:hypothetical protein [Thermosediminibacter litoriperuensis]